MHDPGVGWKQFMMSLEEVLVCVVVAFHLPCPGLTKGVHPCDRSAQFRGCQSNLCLISSVVGGVVCPPLGDLGRALFSQAQLVLWGHPGVSSWLSHEGLTKFEWGFGHELAPPCAVLRHGCPFGEGRREVEVGQVALK